MNGDDVMTAKVITFASTKGGCGKTILSWSLASFLAHQNKKVLLIDLNSQMDLTLEYKLSNQQIKQSSIYRAFVHDADNPQANFPKDLKPAKINQNLSIFTSSKKLRQINNLMRSRMTVAPYVLSHLFSTKSGLGLPDKYDYIIIDTHNDTGIPVKNALVVSDYVLSPVIPSSFGINSVADTIGAFDYLKQHLLNPMTQQSFIHAKLYFIGNLIKFNTKTSHQFLVAVSKNPKFIAFVHELELFNKAQTVKTNIFEMAEKNRRDDKTLHQRIIPQLKKIVNVISK